MRTPEVLAARRPVPVPVRGLAGRRAARVPARLTRLRVAWLPLPWQRVPGLPVWCLLPWLLLPLLLLPWLLLPIPALAADLPFAGNGPVSLRVTSLKEARYRSTLRQQYDFSCGSAALATLLTHHYGYPVSEQQAFAEMFAGGDQRRIRQEGFSLLDMKRFLAARGFTADGFQQPLDNLDQAGLPAIVLVSEHGYRHFVVVKGVRDGRVLFGDPSGGTRALPRAAFEAIWLNQLLFVIHDGARKPRFNDGSDWAAAPRMRPGDALVRDSLQRVTLPKLDAGDF